MDASRKYSIYIMRLTDGCFYVGRSTNVERRTYDHLKGESEVTWLKIHPAISIERIYYDCDALDEDKYVIKWMITYGIEKVRGGSFCKPKLTVANKKTLTQIINTSRSLCHRCKQPGHFVSECPTLKSKSGTSGSKSKSLIEKICRICGNDNHATMDCRCVIPGWYVCRYCGKSNHNTKACYFKPK